MKTKKKSPEKPFSQLKAEWYAKLKASGFVDIEQDESKLVTWALYIATNSGRESQIEREAKIEYTSMAARFTHDYKFSIELEKVIWEYWANGLSVREIETVLNKAGISIKKSKVWNIVHKLELIMKSMYLRTK